MGKGILSVAGFLVLLDGAGLLLELHVFDDEHEALHHVGEGCRGLLEALGEALVDLPADLLQAVVGISCQRIDTLADFGV